MKTQRIEKGSCLNCGKLLTAASAQHDHAPKPGAIMVCLYCSHVMEWSGERLVELSDETIKAIAGDPDVVHAVKVTGLFRVLNRAPRQTAMKTPDALVVMRLADMHRQHPAQDNSKVCSKCGERVGIYPSSRRALRDNPGLPVICIICATSAAPPDLEARPAGTIEEVRMSAPKTEAEQ